MRSGARRIDDDHVRVSGAVAKLLECLAHLAGVEGAVAPEAAAVLAAGADGAEAAGVAAALDIGGLDTLANFAKLAAVTLLAFWFLTYFETEAWVVVMALIIPMVDAISVWRGPTRHIVEQQPEVFTTLSFAFPVPGERSSAHLGLPDLLFFALFLAATARFRLRTVWTWVAMTASFGATLALTVLFEINGLPALPLLCVGFLLPNADLLWQRMRSKGIWGRLS